MWSHNRLSSQIKSWLLNSRTGLVLGLLSIILLQYFYQLYQLKQIKTQIPLLQQTLERQQHKQVLFKRYQQQLQQWHDVLEQHAEGWMKTTQPTVLLEKLEKMAHVFGLTLESLEPGEAVQKRDYHVWTCRLILTGTYQAMTLFIQRLSQWSPLVTWRQLKLEKIITEEATDNSPLLRLQGTLRFYVSQPNHGPS